MCLPVDEIEMQVMLPMKGPVPLEERPEFVCGLGNQLVPAEVYFHINGINGYFAMLVFLKTIFFFFGLKSCDRLLLGCLFIDSHNTS